MTVQLARHYRAPSRDQLDANAGSRLLQKALAASRRRRRQVILAARQPIRVVGSAVDTYELFHAVVIRREVFVANRPGNLPTVTLGFGKVEIGVA